MFILDTLKPYKELDSGGIQYSVCRDYSHISRHRALRQVVHKPLDSDRYMALEVPNPIQSSNIDFVYHNVTPDEENRLDHILAIFFPSQEATAEHDQIRIILPEKAIKGPAVTFAYCRKQQLVIIVTTTSIHLYPSLYLILKPGVYFCLVSFAANPPPGAR